MLLTFIHFFYELPLYAVRQKLLIGPCVMISDALSVEKTQLFVISDD
jgi:hypothetical protein